MALVQLATLEDATHALVVRSSTLRTLYALARTLAHSHTRCRSLNTQWRTMNAESLDENASIVNFLLYLQCPVRCISVLHSQEMHNLALDEAHNMRITFFKPVAAI